MTVPEQGDRDGGVYPRLNLDKRGSGKLRASRLRRLNTRVVPRLRLLGFNLLILWAILHNRFFLGAVDWETIVPYALAMEAYAVVTWLALQRWYDPDRKPDLGLVFLVLDMVSLAFTVYVTGADRSWLFYILLFRVADQSQTTVRRVLAFSHLAALSYLAIVAYVAVVDGRVVDWPVELVKTLFLYLGALYIASTARPAERLRNRLRQVVRVAREAVRTLEDKSEELERSRAEAEAGSRAKSEFMSRVSHELRTPMNAIMGFAQLLEMESLTDEQRAQVAEILDGGRHLLDIINDVMDIARVETGTLARELEPVDLRASIEEVLTRARPAAEPAGVTLTLAAPTECAVWVMANERKLRQVIANLLSNGIKYNTRAGAVHISCDSVDDRVRVSVTDTGPGIPADLINEAFVPFHRLGAERSDISGTGLGLPVARSLVEAMGGTLEVETEVGVGSTFWFELDTAAAPAEDPWEPVARESRPGTRRVLYIDDHPDNVALVRRILARRPNIEVSSAALGREGLERARRDRPDLVLLDLELPDISGREVLTRLREDPATRHIPVVVVSAEAARTKIERLLADGARAYFTMPYHVTRFLDVVDEMVADQR